MKPDQHIAAMIWWIVALLPVSLALLAILEGWLAWTGRQLITPYVRAWAGDHRVWAEGLIAAILVWIGIGLAHFWLDR